MSSDPAPTELLPSGPDGWITFLYYFGLTSLIAIVPMARFWHLDFGQPASYQYALIPGILGGVWGAYWHRSITLEFTGKKPPEMLPKLEQKLKEMGLTKRQDEGAVHIYAPPAFPALWMGKVRVWVQARSIKIVGRAVHMRELQKWLAEEMFPKPTAPLRPH
ncbi:MAG: hypothetical protein Q6J74_10650 [Gloeomargarita sp. DG02_1_bins_92]